MAERKKTAKQPAKTAAKKTKQTAKKSAPKGQQEAMFRERRRFWSFILFFYGIFEMILTFVKGDGLWKILMIER